MENMNHCSVTQNCVNNSPIETRKAAAVRKLFCQGSQENAELFSSSLGDSSVSKRLTESDIKQISAFGSSSTLVTNASNGHISEDRLIANHPQNGHVIKGNFKRDCQEKRKNFALHKKKENVKFKKSSSKSLDDADLEAVHVRKVYDHIAPHIDDIKQKTWPRVKKFLKSLKSGSMVADVGCGNGRYLNINPSVFKIGSDICMAFLQSSSRQGFEVVCADNLSLPYRDGLFDAVISVGVIHHFASFERRAKALQELVRIVTQGGLVMVYVWAFEQKYRRFDSQDILVPWHKPKTSVLRDRRLQLASMSDVDGLSVSSAGSSLSDDDSVTASVDKKYVHQPPSKAPSSYNSCISSSLAERMNGQMTEDHSEGSHTPSAEKLNRQVSKQTEDDGITTKASSQCPHSINQTCQSSQSIRHHEQSIPYHKHPPQIESSSVFEAYGSGCRTKSGLTNGSFDTDLNYSTDTLTQRESPPPKAVCVKECESKSVEEHINNNGSLQQDAFPNLIPPVKNRFEPAKSISTSPCSEKLPSIHPLANTTPKEKSPSLPSPKGRPEHIPLTEKGVVLQPEFSITTPAYDDCNHLLSSDLANPLAHVNDRSALTEKSSCLPSYLMARPEQIPSTENGLPSELSISVSPCLPLAEVDNHKDQVSNRKNGFHKRLNGTAAQHSNLANVGCNSQPLISCQHHDHDSHNLPSYSGAHVYSANNLQGTNANTADSHSHSIIRSKGLVHSEQHSTLAFSKQLSDCRSQSTTTTTSVTAATNTCTTNATTSNATATVTTCVAASTTSSHGLAANNHNNILDSIKQRVKQMFTPKSPQDKRSHRSLPFFVPCRQSAEHFQVRKFPESSLPDELGLNESGGRVETVHSEREEKREFEMKNERNDIENIPELNESERGELNTSETEPKMCEVESERESERRKLVENGVNNFTERSESANGNEFGTDRSESVTRFDRKGIEKGEQDESEKELKRSEPENERERTVEQNENGERLKGETEYESDKRREGSGRKFDWSERGQCMKSCKNNKLLNDLENECSTHNEICPTADSMITLEQVAVQSASSLPADFNALPCKNMPQCPSSYHDCDVHHCHHNHLENAHQKNLLNGHVDFCHRDHEKCHYHNHVCRKNVHTHAPDNDHHENCLACHQGTFTSHRHGPNEVGHLFSSFDNDGHDVCTDACKNCIEKCTNKKSGNDTTCNPSMQSHSCVQLADSAHDTQLQCFTGERHTLCHHSTGLLATEISDILDHQLASDLPSTNLKDASDSSDKLCSNSSNAAEIPDVEDPIDTFSNSPGEELSNSQVNNGHQHSNSLGEEFSNGEVSDADLCRYYHVFREGELVDLIVQHVPGVRVVEAFYDHANWGVILEKL